MSSICPILRCTLLSALALAGATFVAPASAQQPSAQPVPCRHGVLEAKSDAGFVFMPSKGGFAEKQGLKVEMLQFKGDALAPQGADRRRPRYLRGLPRRADAGRIERGRHQAARLLLAAPHLRHL